MKDKYDFSKGKPNKNYAKVVSQKHSWILKPEECRFCGKLTFANLDDAEYVAKRTTDGKQIISLYPCPYEEGWHLTSLPR